MQNKIFILLILLIIPANAFFCYQEDPTNNTVCGNSSDPVGTKSKTGTYAARQDGTLAYDSNWATFAQDANGGAASYMYVNYYRPSRPSNETVDFGTSKWQISGSNATGGIVKYNITLPSYCTANGTNITYSLRMESFDEASAGIGESYNAYSCWNGTLYYSQYQLGNCGNNATCVKVYEDGMFWSIDTRSNVTVRCGTGCADVIMDEQSSNTSVVLDVPFLPIEGITIDTNGLPGYTFSNWSDDNAFCTQGNSSSQSTTAKLSKGSCTITANYVPLNTMTVNWTPLSCGVAYGNNSSVSTPANLTINATAFQMCAFDSWTLFGQCNITAEWSVAYNITEYQEDANATWNDGTGWAPEITGHDYEKEYDGDWGTYATIQVAGWGNIYHNYTLRNNATIVVWQVKDNEDGGGNESENITLPQSCIKQNIEVRTNLTHEEGMVRWMCKGSDDWIVLREYNSYKFYEDGIYFTNNYNTTYANVTMSSGSCIATANFNTTTNTPPEITSISISPNPAYSTSTLLCTIIATDNQTSFLNATFEWYLNGINQTTLAGNYSNISNGTETTISGLTGLNYGENWACAVQVFDGQNYSAWAYSENRTIWATESGGGGGYIQGGWVLQNGTLHEVDTDIFYCGDVCDGLNYELSLALAAFIAWANETTLGIGNTYWLLLALLIFKAMEGF
jgi:hypothetical protein